MIKIDTWEKACAYAIGMLDLETGEIGSEEVKRQLSEMEKYCNLYGESGSKGQEACSNLLNCRYHPIPSYCEMKFYENIVDQLELILKK